MQGAIIGFGTIAQGHMAGFAQVSAIRITAVVDPSSGRRAAAEARGLRAFPTLAELLASQRPDFLDVCTPPNSHWEYVSQSLALGIPVLCEKPVFVPDAVGYQEMLKTIETSGSLVYPCQNYKFAPVFENVRRRLHAGQIGDIKWARIGVLRAGHARGVEEWNADWRRVDEFSAGGVLRDHGPHGIYLATSLTGLVPESVSCVVGQLVKSAWTNEDTAIVRISCTQGATVELYLSWAAKLRDSRYTIVGTRGFISVENDNLLTGTDGLVEQEVIRSGFDDPAHGEWFGAMLADFEAVVADASSRAEYVRGLLEEAVMTSAVIDAAYRSAEQGGVWCDIAKRVEA